MKLRSGKIIGTQPLKTQKKDIKKYRNLLLIITILFLINNYQDEFMKYIELSIDKPKYILYPILFIFSPFQFIFAFLIINFIFIIDFITLHILNNCNYDNPFCQKFNEILSMNFSSSLLTSSF